MKYVSTDLIKNFIFKKISFNDDDASDMSVHSNNFGIATITLRLCRTGPIVGNIRPKIVFEVVYRPRVISFPGYNI